MGDCTNTSTGKILKINIRVKRSNKIFDRQS